MNKFNCGIYRINSTRCSKFYIGSSKNIKRRWVDHRKMLKKGNHENPYLQNFYNKYGKDCLEFVKVESCDELDLISIEQNHIDRYDFDKLFNLNKIAGAPPTDWTDEMRESQRQRMSDPSYNPMSNPESRKKISDAQRYYTDNDARGFCEEYLNSGDTMKVLAERRGINEWNYFKEVQRVIDEYVKGIIYDTRYKNSLRYKRYLYNLPTYKKMYDEYMSNNLNMEDTGKKFGLSKNTSYNIRNWFRDGHKILGIEPDPHYQEKAKEKMKVLKYSNLKSQYNRSTS